VPTRRERSDAKPNIGQGHRYPGGHYRFLCRNDENLQFRRVNVRSSMIHGRGDWAQWGAAAAVHRLVNREVPAK